jgi:exopolyphosphatase/guanosine-5'-triphosphate,3'-diphosphate pyrophosphatase
MAENAIPSEVATPAPERRVVAAIDIGSSALRLDIGEVGAQGDLKLLESLRQGVRLGKDVFTKGRVEQETLRRCVAILKNYGRLLKEYGVTRPDQLRAVATSFAREAANRDMFVDRVSIATGIDVTVLEESEEARLTYLAVRALLEAGGLLAAGNVAVLEIGSGQTILLYIRGGRVTVAQSFRFGALRTRELVEAGGAAGPQLKGVLKAYATELVEQVLQAIPREKVSALVVMGAAPASRPKRPMRSPSGAIRAWPSFPRRSWRNWRTRSRRRRSTAWCARTRMTYQDAETVAPALMSAAQAARP